AVVRSGYCDMAYSEAAKITVNPAAVNAAAGPDQVLCNESSVILNGNSPGATSARWTLVSGPTGISFDDETNPKASVSGLQPGETYVFRWTIEGHAPCPPTFDEVTITNRPPLTTASAGSDAVFCDRSNVNNFYTLHASPIKAFETGTWTISSQPAGSNAFFADLALPNTKILGLTGRTYRLKWSVRNDACTMESEDEMELQVYEKPEAGLISGPVNTCFDGSFNLNYTEVSGKIVNWQESDDNFNWRELAETSAVLSVSNYTQKKWFRVKLRSEGVSCNTIIFSQAVSVN